MRIWFPREVSILILLIQSFSGQEYDIDDDLDKPIDCSDHLMNGNYKDGIYTIFLNSKTLNVYCDMTTDGGGWTVIQRRGNFTRLEDFNRDWFDYKNGFGNIERDFWLGNENIHILSTQRSVEIRFDLGDIRGSRSHAVYRNFVIDDEGRKYALHISGYNGTAGDGMKFHNGHEFSTKDKGKNRGVLSQYGAWWIFDWSYVNLNGLYRPGKEDFRAIHWYKWLEDEGLAFTEMKVRQH